MKFTRGRASNAARDVAAEALARMVLEHLELSGFVIMKKSPGRAHSGRRPTAFIGGVNSGGKVYHYTG